jgi:hypothetical protein
MSVFRVGRRIRTAERTTELKMGMRAAVRGNRGEHA